MINKLLLVVLLSAWAVSCKEISFTEPQPAGKNHLEEIPKKLQGKYLVMRENGELAQDTIVIGPQGYRFDYTVPSTGDSRYDRGALSDSLVLKSFKGYYFLNIHEKPEWILRVLKQEKNGDVIYMAPEQEGVDFKDYVKKLAAEIRIDSMQTNDKTIYQIHPTPNQLVSLVEKGFFTRVVMKKVK